MQLLILLQLAVLAHSIRPPSKHRLFHYVFLVALFFGASSYIIMAVVLHSDPPEAVFIKSTHWLVAWPLVAVVLGLSGGVGWIKMITNVILAATW